MVVSSVAATGGGTVGGKTERPADLPANVTVGGTTYSVIYNEATGQTRYEPTSTYAETIGGQIASSSGGTTGTVEWRPTEVTADKVTYGGTSPGVIAQAGIPGIAPTIITSPGFQAKLDAAIASGQYPSQAVRTLTPATSTEAVPGPVGFSPATNPFAYAGQKTIGLGKDILSNLGNPYLITQKASAAASAISSGFKEWWGQPSASTATRLQPVYSDANLGGGPVSQPVTTWSGFKEAMVIGTAAGMLYAPFVDVKMPGGLLARGPTREVIKTPKTEAEKLKLETEADRIAKAADKAGGKIVPGVDIVGTEATTRVTAEGIPKVVETKTIFRTETSQGPAAFVSEAQLNKIAGTTGTLPTEKLVGGGQVYQIQLPKGLTYEQLGKMSYSQLLSESTMAKVLPESKAFTFKQSLISKELVSISRETPSGKVIQESSGIALGSARPVDIFKVNKAGEFIKTRGKLPDKSLAGAQYKGVMTGKIISPELEVQSWFKIGKVETIFKGKPSKITTIGGMEEIYISKVPPTKVITLPKSYAQKPGMSMPKLPEIYGKQAAGTMPTTAYAKIYPVGAEVFAVQTKEMLGQFLTRQVRAKPEITFAPTKVGYQGSTMPIARQIPIVKQISSELSFIREIPTTRQPGITRTGEGVMSITRIIPTQFQYTPTAERTATFDITRQIQRTTETTITRTPEFTTTFNPPGTPPPFSWPSGPGAEFNFAYGRSKKSRRKYQYVPSFGAVIFKTFGKQPKKTTFSGFETRPVTGFSKRMQKLLKGL